MGLTDKNKENNEEIPEDENNSDRELSIQQRWLDWVKIAPFNALKFTLLWAILGGNVVLLTTKSGAWPYDETLENLLRKRKVALRNDDTEDVKQITKQLEDEGVIIDSNSNKWMYKEFSGELNGDCFRVPVSLADYYDDKYPTNPNAPPFCSRDDLPPDPTQNEDYSSVDLWKPKKDFGEKKDKQEGGGARTRKRQKLVKQKGGLGGNCQPINEDNAADKSALQRKCGRRGKCPPINDSCMGGAAYACLHPFWKHLKFWSKRTTPESADEFLNSFRAKTQKNNDMKMLLSEQDPELGFFYHRYERWRAGSVIRSNKIWWNLTVLGYRLKRLPILMLMYLIIGYNTVVKKTLQFLSGTGGGSTNPMANACSSKNKDVKPKKGSAFQFWFGALVFGFLLGIFPFKINAVPGWLTPMSLVMLIIALVGTVSATPILFLLGGYILFPPVAGPASIIAAISLGLLLLFYPIMIFRKHGGYLGPLGKAIGDNFGGLSVLFLLITGAFTTQSKLNANEKQGVYLGMLLFGIPSLFKQFKSKTPPPGGPKVPQAPKVPQGPKVPSAK